MPSYDQSDHGAERQVIGELGGPVQRGDAREPNGSDAQIEHGNANPGRGTGEDGVSTGQAGGEHH